MRHSHKLQPLAARHGPIEFEWDPDTGALAGPDAARVLDLVNEANRAGIVTRHPWPTPNKITDPLRRPAEMAAILSLYWELDAELAAAFPAPPKGEGEAEGLVH